MALNAFSQRIRGNPRIAEAWSWPHPWKTQVLAIKDQLLVSPDVPASVRTALHDLDAHQRTTVFHGLHVPPHEDIEIWMLPPDSDVFAATDQLRLLLPAEEGSSRVSPNHVLIPAPNGDNCPHGAPSEVPGGDVLPDLTGGGAPDVAVTVIDSGYQWDGNWGENPLAQLAGGLPYHREAEWFDWTTNLWSEGPPDLVDAEGRGRLDALAGHGNFVAGVIAQHSRPELRVWNHNGSFSWTSP